MISVKTALAHLRLPPSSDATAVRDDLLTRIIGDLTAILSQEANVYLGLPLTKADVVPVMGNIILLPQVPILEDDGTGPKVQVEQRLWLSQSWAVMDPSVWMLDGRALRLLEWRRYYGLSAWWIKRGQDLARVTYRRGYKLDAGPPEFMALVTDAVVATWRQLGQEGLVNERIGNYSYTNSELKGVADWPQIVKRWRRALV